MSDPIALILQKIRACNPKNGSPNDMADYESKCIHQIIGVIFTLQDEDEKATACFEALQQQCAYINFGVKCVFDVRKKLSECPDWTISEDVHICGLVQKYVNEQFELLQTNCAKKDISHLALWNACIQWVTKLNSWGFKIEVPSLTKEEIQQYKNDATFDASLVNWKFKTLGITKGDTPFLAILDHDETMDPDMYTVCTDGSTIPSQTTYQLSKDAQELLKMKDLCLTKPNWKNTSLLDSWMGATFDEDGHLVSLHRQMKRGMMVDVSPFEHLEQLNLVSSSLEFIRFGHHPKLHMIDRLMQPDDTTELVLTQKLPSGIELNGCKMDSIEDAIRVRWEETELSKDAQALLELKPYCMFDSNWDVNVPVDKWTGATFDEDGNLTLLCKPFRCDTLDVSPFKHLKVLNQNEGEINTIRLGTHGSTIPSQTTYQLSKDAQELLEMKHLCLTEPNWSNRISLKRWMGVTFDESGNLVSMCRQMKRGMMVDVSPFEHLEQLNLVSSSLEFIRFGHHPKLHMIDRLMQPDDTTELVLTQKLPSGIELNGCKMDDIEDAVRIRWECLPLSEDAQALLALKPFCMFKANWHAGVPLVNWSGTTFNKDGHLTMLCKPFRCDTLDVSPFEHLKVLNQNEGEINTIRLGTHPNLENVYRGKAYGFSGPPNLVCTTKLPNDVKLNGISLFGPDHVRIHYEFSEAETKEKEPTNFLSKDARELLKLKPFCSYSPNWDETKNMYGWSSVEFNAKGHLILINKCFTTNLLDLSPFEHLETLYLSHYAKTKFLYLRRYAKNKIDAIKFGNHPNLKKIDIRNNPIDQLCTDGLPEDCEIIKSSHTELISNAIGGGGGGGNGYGEAPSTKSSYLSEDACALLDLKQCFSPIPNWSLETPMEQWTQVKFDSDGELLELYGSFKDSTKFIDISQYKNLRRMMIIGNNITQIKFGTHPDLTDVDIFNNNVGELTAIGRPKDCEVHTPSCLMDVWAIECST